MTKKKVTSDRQSQANQKNALLSTGPKTPEGKAIVKRNAVKHGLLAKEVVITIGEGAEDPEEFEALLYDLNSQLNPEGTLEGMLVENIAACWWRLKRTHRYEAGSIRAGMKDTSEKFYKKKEYNDKTHEMERLHKTDEEIENEITEKKDLIRAWKADKVELARRCREGQSTDQLLDWETNWESLVDKLESLLEEKGFNFENSSDPKHIREFLTSKAGWDDKQIWQAHIELCGEMAKRYKKEMNGLKNEKEANQVKLQLSRMLTWVPEREELDRLLRYEAAIERQFYKALNQLERLQRMRLGDKIPARLAVDLDVQIEN